MPRKKNIRMCPHCKSPNWSRPRGEKMAKEEKEWMRYRKITIELADGGFLVQRHRYEPDPESFIRTTFDEVFELIKKLLTDNY